MSYKPLVSVVTPSFNQGAYIEQTILSIRQQSYPRVEHIIVDGGSTDDTLDIIRSYEGTYDMRWLSEPDRGMYEAINKGLRMARGDVLAYLNSDDMYLPWTVEVAVRALIERSDVGFVSGDALSVDEKTGSGGLLFYPPFRLGFFHRSGLLAQPTVFWRREVYEVCGGFDESLQFVGDWEYWARIGERYQAGKLNEVLALWRIHTEAKTVAQMSLLLREWNEVKGRYVPVGSFGYRILALVDRIYYFLWRRYCLLRFVWEYGWGRESVTPDNRAWTAFLACNASSIRLSATIGALLPVMGRHFSRRMVRVDPRFYGE